MKVLNRDSCEETRAPSSSSPTLKNSSKVRYIKDLNKIGRPLEHVVLVDDNPHSALLQPHNHLPIRSYRGEADDCELETTLSLLKEIQELDDVRLALSKNSGQSDFNSISHQIT